MTTTFSLPDSAAGRQPITPSGVRVRAGRLMTARYLDVQGDIDAANAGQLVSRVEGSLADCHELVLDLSKVDFLGLESFSAIKHVQSYCHRNGVRWVLVPSAAVARVMRLCDRDRSVPTAMTAEAAFYALRAHRAGTS